MRVGKIQPGCDRPHPDRIRGRNSRFFDATGYEVRAPDGWKVVKNGKYN